MLTQREQVIMDVNMLLDEVFTSMDFIPTRMIAGELQKLGNPLYESRSLESMCVLIADALRCPSSQRRINGIRFRGFMADEIRNADIRTYEKPACCTPGSAAYDYRHRMALYFRGSPRAHDCARCDSRADDWATVRGSCPGHDPRDGYLPMCSRCHSAYDHEER